MGSYLLGSLGSLHMPRVRSYKRGDMPSAGTHLLHIDTLPPLPASTLPAHRLSQTCAHTACSPHTLTPSISTLHIAPRELLSPTAPCAGCQEGRTGEKEGGPGPGYPDGVLRAQPGCWELMVGVFIDAPQNGADPKVPAFLFFPSNPQPSPHAVGMPSARKHR